MTRLRAIESTSDGLELAELDLLALDSDPLRLSRVQDTLNRLQLKAELKAGDGRQPQGWWASCLVCATWARSSA